MILSLYVCPSNTYKVFEKAMPRLVEYFPWLVIPKTMTDNPIIINRYIEKLDVLINFFGYHFNILSPDYRSELADNLLTIYKLIINITIPQTMDLFTHGIRNRAQIEQITKLHLLSWVIAKATFYELMEQRNQDKLRRSSHLTSLNDDFLEERYPDID